MWSFQKLLFNLCSALNCVSSVAGLIHVFGYEGRDGKVSCSYPHGYENYEKYLCRNDCDYSDILITTSQMNKSRHFIYDDKSARIFTTTISNFLSTDAGNYWCGVSRNAKDIYTEVKLEIRQDMCCSTVNNIQGHEEGSVSISCPYDSDSVNNLKYICRGNRPSTCLQQAVITSDTEQNGRLTFKSDTNSRIFKVTISKLTLNDSGLYLCGVQKITQEDVFSAVELKVKEWCCLKSHQIRGNVGRPITLQCPYPPQHRNNRKFVCKGSQRSGCSDIMIGQSRFSLHNVSFESFSVTITQLEEEDAGTYWCRSDPEWTVGNYTQFHLSVEKEQNAGTEKELEELPAHRTTAGLPDAVSYSLSVGLPVVLLLMLTIILVKVYRNKCHKVKETKVIADGNKLDFTEQDVWGGEDVYQNHDAVVMRSKQQNASYYVDDVNGDEADYENFTAAESIYGNQ
ncbi:polymeric immunoglobulin receptor-like isoform X4 [Girardinichthys multiradiatus]|uniref:polymeric immunoglobulin receptor-like isoform X4 n=1 Tax=Girardinichthys multiradiatus TaxID=208333 RepID=UPI001FAB9652|nr:polymeric immunoglobulin receptor-like isoform X4 [Girardinichthys multiradiatus]